MNRVRLASLALLVLAPISAAAQSTVVPMPKVEGESLAGHHVVLPDAASGRIAVLIFGFTKASKVPTAAWAKKISTDFASQPAFALYQLPVLEDVPRFVRSMVISSIRKGTPQETRDHFVPILNGEAELKKLVSYKQQDDAYLVILNRAGMIVAQIKVATIDSPVSDPAYAPLKAQLESLLNAAK